MSLVTRRTLLGNAATGGLTLGAGAVLAACGSSSSSGSQPASGSTPATTAVGTPKRGGTLVAALSGGSSADALDPNNVATNTDAARLAQLYDSLVWTNAAGQPYLKLAEEMTPNKAGDVWVIRLRQGVTFHDGKDLTADDLIFSINRVINPKSPGQAANLLQGIHAAGIKKLDQRTISVPFAQPYSTFSEAMSTIATVYVVPVGFDPSKPVGTGPFQYVSFTAGQQSVFSRNPNYWNAPLPYLDQLTMTDFADETSQVNTLLGGQADVVNSLSAATLGTITGSGKKAAISPGGNYTPFTMRVDAAPFNDVRVRQAFRLALDREKMLATVFDGHGTIGNDIFGIWDSDYDSSIPQRSYDPEQAKSLLKAAGHDGLTVTMVTSDVAAGATDMAQVYTQQASASGITVNLRQVTVTDFFGPTYLKWVLAQDVWSYGPYLPTVALSTLPSSPFNETHFADPAYTKLYGQALATLDPAQRTEIAHEMQMIDYEQGGYIIPFFPSIIDGYAPHVNGVVTSKTGQSFNNWDFAHMWLS
jgi:peptide/nickel transport system substrate-binding protein